MSRKFLPSLKDFPYSAKRPPHRRVLHDGRSVNILVYKIYANLVVLIFTPGPIVEAITTLLRYCPLAADGFAFTIASIKVWKFSSNCSSVKEAFPTGTWIILALSSLYSILPALIRKISFGILWSVCHCGNGYRYDS